MMSVADCREAMSMGCMVSLKDLMRAFDEEEKAEVGEKEEAQEKEAQEKEAEA